MKNIYKLCIIAFVFLATSLTMNAAITYSLDNRCGTSQLVVLVTPDINYSGGQAVWSPAVFTISWPMTLGIGALGTVTNQNGFGFATAGSVGNDGTYYYQKYAHTAATTKEMTAGISYEVARIALIGGNGVFGTFEIPASTNAWIGSNNGFSVFSNSGGNQVVSPYGATSSGSIPMFVGIFWDGTSWCGGSGVNEQPGDTDDALRCYINGTGAQLTTPVATPAEVSDLIIKPGGQLTIMPGGALTVLDTTYINNPQGLVIASGPSGTGSFKNQPTTTKTLYSNGGTVKAQVYMANNAPVGDLFIHLIGSPVYDPSLGEPTGLGPAYMSLGAFELENGSTFAYKYDEPTNSWLNIFETTDLIPRLGGLALSDISGVSKTLSFIGKLNTGSVGHPTTPSAWARSLTPATGNGFYVYSNPYTCGLYLSQFYVDNNSRGLVSSFWTWEQEANDNYGTYYYDGDFDEWYGTLDIYSANGVVGPGQGFFGQLNSVVTSAPRTLSSTAANSDLERTHIHTPILKSSPSNMLRVRASGNNSNDEIIVKFHQNASFEYESVRDFDKWFSMSSDATQIYTYAGEHYLTVNSLPNLVPGQMTSVPMDFLCGEEGTYAITASQIETFEEGTEIWLEDLQTGAEWHSLNENPVYTFSATPGDVAGRFILHFFGPTGIDDPVAEISPVQIYGWGQDAYIVNKGKETVKEYVAYDMMGRELHRGTLPNSTVNKVQIGDVSAYYIVKVITKEGNIYTDKVYITK